MFSKGDVVRLVVSGKTATVHEVDNGFLTLNIGWFKRVTVWHTAVIRI